MIVRRAVSGSQDSRAFLKTRLEFIPLSFPLSRPSKVVPQTMSSLARESCENRDLGLTNGIVRRIKGGV